MFLGLRNEHGLEEFRSETKFSDDTEFQHMKVSDLLWADISIFWGTNTSLGLETENEENLSAL